MSTRIPLYRALFGEQEKTLLQSADFKVSAWAYPSGVLALSLENSRGRLVVLPYQGQMIWSAVFDGCDLTMTNLFDQPRPSPTVIGTYGCFMFHSGLLRNGCPAPTDDHALHGEMPCAPMDTAWLEIDDGWLRLGGEYEYAQGFGDRYRARPSVTLRAGSALFDISMDVTNLAGKPMELMYMAHMNYAYVDGGRFVEPLGMERLRLRSSVPDHVKPTPDWSAYMVQLAEHPQQLAQLDQSGLYDPEIVFFFDGVGTDALGQAHFLLDHPGGAAFYTRYRPEQFEHAARWVLHNPDQQVAAFVLPSTCEPEGYNAEKAKGNVRSLAPGASAAFSVTTGYLSAKERHVLLG
ncbi:aldose 1-epimerase family protein [Pseudomonas sp. ADAK18]|uniref:aldose 1-epimerase family protein n=1 Tax=Pseudomonas sp. ADAK18 TaxID=2730848 RepID=UPI0014629ABD|nr:aldose 1-epimerase family protein [Pseudomonas sp. ADAK18]QJI29060.1 aldose 1-epimerase family protein [Pseudomonas sp. ADAK18]